MPRTTTLILAILLISVFAAGQDTATECPKLEIIGPRRSIEPKMTSTFVLDMTEDRPEEFRYEWSVENGEIVKGQGTRVAEVASTDYGSKAKITATVVGLPITCANTAAVTVDVDSKPEWHMLDEWGEMRKRDQQARLHLFFHDLNEGQMGLMIIGTPRVVNQPRIVKRRIKLIQEQAKFRKFDTARLVYCVEAGSRTAMRLYRFRPEFQEMFPYPDCTPVPLETPTYDDRSTTTIMARPKPRHL